MHIRWMHVSQQMIERSSQSIDVGTGISMLFAGGKLFKGGVGRRAQTAQFKFSFRVIGVKQFDQAKVHQFDPPLQV